MILNLIFLVSFLVNASFLNKEYFRGNGFRENRPEHLECKSDFYKDVLQLQLQYRQPSLQFTTHVVLIEKADALLEDPLAQKKFHIWKEIFEEIKRKIHVEFAIYPDTFIEYLRAVTKGCFIPDDGVLLYDDDDFDYVMPKPQELSQITMFYWEELMKFIKMEYKADPFLNELCRKGLGSLRQAEDLDLDELNVINSALDNLYGMIEERHQLRSLPRLKLYFILFQLSRYTFTYIFNSISEYKSACIWFDYIFASYSNFTNMLAMDIWIPPEPLEVTVVSQAKKIRISKVTGVLVPNPDTLEYSNIMEFKDDGTAHLYISASEKAETQSPGVLQHIFSRIFETRLLL